MLPERENCHPLDGITKLQRKSLRVSRIENFAVEEKNSTWSDRIRGQRLSGGSPSTIQTNQEARKSLSEAELIDNSKHMVT